MPDNYYMFYAKPLAKRFVSLDYIHYSVESTFAQIYAPQEIRDHRRISTKAFLPKRSYRNILPGMFSFGGVDIVSGLQSSSATFSNSFAPVGEVPEVKVDQISEYDRSPVADPCRGMIYSPTIADHTIDLYAYYHHHMLKGDMVIYLGFFSKAAYLVIPLKYFLPAPFQRERVYFIYDGTLVATKQEIPIRTRALGLKSYELELDSLYSITRVGSEFSLERLEPGFFFAVDFDTIHFTVFVPNRYESHAYALTVLFLYSQNSMSFAVVQAHEPTTQVHFMDVLATNCTDGHCMVGEQYSLFCSLTGKFINSQEFYGIDHYKNSFSHPVYLYKEDDHLHHSALSCAVCGVSHQQGYREKLSWEYSKDRAHIVRSMNSRASEEDIIQTPWSMVTGQSYGFQLSTGITKSSIVRSLARLVRTTGVCACYFSLPCGQLCSAVQIQSVFTPVIDYETKDGFSRRVTVGNQSFLLPVKFDHDLSSTSIPKVFEVLESKKGFFDQSQNPDEVFSEILRSLPPERLLGTLVEVEDYLQGTVFSSRGDKWTLCVSDD